MTAELIETHPVEEYTDSVYRHASLGTWKRSWRWRTVKDGEEMFLDLTVDAYLVPLSGDDDRLGVEELDDARQAQKEWEEHADTLEMEDEEWEAWYAANPAPLWYAWGVSTEWELFADLNDKLGSLREIDYDLDSSEDAYTSQEVAQGCGKAQLESFTVEDFNPLTRKFVSGDIMKPRFPEPDTTTIP